MHAQSGRRVDALDLVRGLVMVLMAIDHVRVYSGLPAGGPTWGIFLTRWVTHFCAPAFAFLAGTGAFLYARRAGDLGRVSRYLVTRGLLLVVLEMTVIRFFWTFNARYGEFVLAGVIWMLGWCLVILAGLIRLRVIALTVVGGALLLLQRVFQFLPRLLPGSIRGSAGWLANFIYPTAIGGPENVAVLYTIVPWVGIMALGAAFGSLYQRSPDERRRICQWLGGAATAAFVVITTIMTMAEPTGPAPRLFAALSPQKYPASPLFVLMTLGPVVALLPAAERARGIGAHLLTTFGRVPMFFYLLHIPTIHLAALLVSRLRDGAIHSAWYATAPFTAVPADHRWSLPLLYVVFAAVIAALYIPCRWYADLKARRSNPWLRLI